MAANTDPNSAIKFELPYPDTAELKSTQSVRATFRLPEHAILSLNIVSNQLGVKQKSLFDHLIADTDALETIARRLSQSKPRPSGGVQKTFVISKKTLSTLQKMAADYQASRDALVEFSIRRLKPVIEQEKSKLDARKKIAARIKTALASQKNLLDDAQRQLGAEDPICEHLAYAMERFDSAYTAIAAFVKKSEKISELGT